MHALIVGWGANDCRVLLNEIDICLDPSASTWGVSRVKYFFYAILRSDHFRWLLWIHQGLVEMLCSYR